MQGPAESATSAENLLNVSETLYGSRYALVSRRAFLARVMGAGAVLALGVTACGNDDAEVFATDTTAARSSSTTAGATSSTARSTSTTVATTAAPTTAPPTTKAPTTTAPPTTAAPTTAAPTTAAAPARAAGLTGQATLQFTYAASGGRINNPYVAVWIENAQGQLVHTIALWFLQSQKGMRWLGDLRRWNSVDGSQATIDTVSGATRTPGDYNVSWNLADSAGAPVAAGSYFVCIEAAREHGPYSLVRQAVTLAPGRTTVDLAPNGELSNARFDLVSA